MVNATVLSNLARVDRIRILKELFGRIIVPMQVYEEILRGIEAGYTFLKTVDEIAEEEDWMNLEPLKNKKERRLFKDLLERVGYGEAAGIAIAKERDLFFPSDDKIARRAAKEHGVEVSGTLGILQIAIEEGKLSTEEEVKEMERLDRITINPNVCLGQPTIRGMRITVSVILKMLAGGKSIQEVLEAYPELEEEDVQQAIQYAAWVVSEQLRMVPTR